MNENNNETKKCGRCSLIKSVNEFYKDSTKLDKLRYICKNCVKKEQLKYRWKQEKYYRRNKENRSYMLWKSAKHRAKVCNLDFNIKIVDVVIPEICPVLGMHLKNGNGKVIAESPTIDRIDNNKGYTKDNVKVISFKANTIKNNGSILEHEKVLYYLKQNILFEDYCV